MLCLGVAILLFSAAKTAHPQISTKKPQESMRSSCSIEPFLSASVSTPRHDGVPKTEIRLTNPHTREQGAHMTEPRIPNSQYEIVALIPQYAERTMEHAVEICGAASGEYLLTIYEHGNELYSITISADARDDNDVLPGKFSISRRTG